MSQGKVKASKVMVYPPPTAGTRSSAWPGSSPPSPSPGR